MREVWGSEDRVTSESARRLDRPQISQIRAGFFFVVGAGAATAQLPDITTVRWNGDRAVSTELKALSPEPKGAVATALSKEPASAAADTLQMLG